MQVLLQPLLIVDFQSIFKLVTYDSFFEVRRRQLNGPAHFPPPKYHFFDNFLGDVTFIDRFEEQWILSNDNVSVMQITHFSFTTHLF